MKVFGTVRVPGDKSISHRALILAALGSGSSRVTGILESADVQSTASVLRSLGVTVPRLAADITIVGSDLHGFRESSEPLDCGNSGTTTRLMAGAVAASPFASRFTGDESLSRRPMRRIAAPLEAMGARVEFASGSGTLPMTVHGGALQSISWRTETASAQTKSAILLAGLLGGVSVTVTEPATSRDHTERMLGSLGVRVDRGFDGDASRVTLFPVESLPAAEWRVPGDPSSAAFFAAVATLASSGELLLPDVLLNPTRTGFLTVLRGMGAAIEVDGNDVPGAGERTGLLRVLPARLRGTTIEAATVPSMIDEIPLLACVAARAEGETLITGASELRVKESDRIAAVVGNLQSIGVDAEELPDGMRIVGGSAPLRGEVTTYGDHRIAMAFGVLAALDDNEIRIDDPGCVAISYPEFWADLGRVIT